MPRNYFTTGDVARAVPCDDLTVRRWLADHGIKRPEGRQYRFTERQKTSLVRRLQFAKTRYPKHLLRFERPVNGNRRLQLFFQNPSV